jgi:hypothetical protein
VKSAFNARYCFHRVLDISILQNQTNFIRLERNFFIKIINPRSLKYLLINQMSLDLCSTFIFILVINYVYFQYFQKTLMIILDIF